jgi:two-component system, OmpR family, response regulator
MKVLFVDDHVASATMLADIAEGLGHRAFVAHDCVSARRCCAEETYDLIVMDISLPDGDGRDVCNDIRGLAMARNTRIIALTGHADLEGSSCLSSFDGCIIKPIALQAFEALLTADETSPV